MKIQVFKAIGLILLTAALLAGGAGWSREYKREQHLVRAAQYLAKGDYRRAEDDYLSVLREKFDEIRALRALGMIYFDEGRLPRAGTCLFQTRQTLTNDLAVRVRLASLYLAGNRLREAREEARFVLAHAPDDQDAPLVLAESVRTADDLKAVREELQNLSPPDRPRPACEAALASLSLWEKPPDRPAAQAALQRALEANRQCAAAYGILGLLCESTNGLAQALQAYQSAAEFSAPYSPRQLKYAQAQIAQGDVEGARLTLDALLQRAPEFVAAWHEKARLAAQEKRWDTANLLIGQLLVRDPDHYDGLMLSASMKFTQGANTEGIIELENVARKYPASVPPRYELGKAYLKSGNTDQAARCFREVLNLETNHIPAILALAQLSLLRGDLDATVYPLTQLLQWRPKNQAALELLARAYYNQKQLNEVVRIYRQLAQDHPADPRYPIRIGETLVEQGKLAEARIAFNRADELAPKAPESIGAVQQLIHLNILERQFEPAQTLVDQLMKEDPKGPEPWLLQAEVYLARQTTAGTNQAETALLKAAAMKADYWPAYVSLARLYKESNQNQKALTRLRQVLANNPKDIVALMLTGVILEEEKDYAEAAAAYEQLLGYSPKFAPALNNAAYLYSEQLKNLERAAKHASQAWNLLPGDPATEDTFGWVLFRQGKFALARGLLDESAAKAPRTALVHYHAGMAHYVMGQELPATRYFQTVLDLGEEFPGHDEARKRLAVLAIPATNRTATARAQLEQRIAEQPDDVIALDRLGCLVRDQGEMNRAINCWQTILLANPENVPALLNLIELYAGPLKQPAKALELAQNAYRIAPELESTMRWFGRLSLQLGNHTLAFAPLRDRAILNPNDPNAQLDFAEVAYQMGEIMAAHNAARMATRAGGEFPRRGAAKLLAALTDPATPLPDPKLADETLAQNPDYLPGLMAKAVLAEAQGGGPAAIAAYEKILERFPTFSLPVRKLALLYAQDPRTTQKASEFAARAFGFASNDPELIKILGRLAYTRGDYPRAARLLQQLPVADQIDAQSLFYLGMALRQTKQPQQSRKALQEALRRGLVGTQEQQARKALAEK